MKLIISQIDEFRDAFYAVAKGVEYAGATAETIELTRPFAQINVATSDYAEVTRTLGDDVTVSSTLSVTGVADTFCMFDNTAEGEVDAIFTSTAIPDGDLANLTDKEGHAYKYIAMGYVLVPNNTEEGIVGTSTSVTTIESVVSIDNHEDIVISYEGATIQRNHRTNLVGNLLTTVADYKVVVDEDFVEFIEPDHTYEYENVATPEEANTAFENGQTSLKIASVPEDATIVLPQTLETTSVLLPEIADDKTVTFEYPADVDDDKKPETLYVTVPEGSDNNIVFDVPETTVYVNGQLYEVTAATAYNTLVVTDGTTIEYLIIEKGNVRIEKGGVVKQVKRSDDNPDETTTVTLEEGVETPEYDETDTKLVVIPFTTPDETLSFADQIAATDYGKVTLAKNEILETPITIAANQNVTIDLNGYTLSGNTNGTKNPQEHFLVKGTLTVKNGTVTTQHTGDNLGWNAMTTIFNVTAGGVLNIDNATVENLGGTDMAFCVHLNNWGEVTLNAMNTTFKSPYVGIRVFNSGNDMNNITLNNCDILTGNSCIWVHNYTIADFGNSVEKAEAAAKHLNFDFTKISLARTNGSKSLIRFGFTDSIYYSDIEMTNVVAGNADALVWALSNNKNVLFNNDIKIDPANMSNAYGTTGINVKNGQTIDGNGFTLDVKGAGGTWDSGINTTGGLIKNIKVTGSFRGIFINHNSTHSEPVVLENVTIDGTTYTVSCDQGLNQTLKATGSTFNGWTSFAATLGEASFDGCNFGEGNGYAYCRPYAPATFKDCNFAEGFELDARAKVTFENCKINGVALTADNLSTLVTSNIANASVK